MGGGCNDGARCGEAPYIFMLNVDTEICPDALTELDAVIDQNDPTVGAYELRQKPTETGVYHDPVTMESDWVSGACVVFPRGVYEKAGGFDENIFLYCEDVDISWRIRAYGYKLIYVPKAAVFHYTVSGDKQKFNREFLWTNYTKLLLHYKYLDLRSIVRANKAYLKICKNPPHHFPHVRKQLAQNYLRHIFKIPAFVSWRMHHRDIVKKVPVNFSEGYTVMRGLYEYRPIKENPLVSVIIRAYQNPTVLRETLKSLRHQTYRNFEIVIEEDGEETLRDMLEREFADLPISYEALGEHGGRSKAGNRALARSKGRYINFLDSDDFFYPEHLEVMVASFEKHPDADIIMNGYTIFDTDISYQHPSYVYQRRQIRYFEPKQVTLPTLCQEDPIPILSAMFRRELFEKMGGLREDLEANEDWGMWLRFFTLRPHVYRNRRATCAFVFPYNNAKVVEKIEFYRTYHDRVYDDRELKFTLTAKELSQIGLDMVKEV